MHTNSSVGRRNDICIKKIKTFQRLEKEEEIKENNKKKGTSGNKITKGKESSQIRFKLKKKKMFRTVLLLLFL